MKLNQILLEYQREKTLANYGDGLLKRLRADESGTSELRRYTLYDTQREMQELHSGESEALVYPQIYKRNFIDRAMYEIESADPTVTKEYIRWIITTYIKGGIQRFEDIETRVRVELESFDQLKHSGFFKRCDPELRKYSDIFQFKALSELGIFNRERTPGERMSNTSKDKALQQELIKSGEAEVVLNNDRFLVVIPKTHRASCFFGRNTQWCTTTKGNARDHNMYSSRGPLYTILEKSTNKRWQFHFESGQFMDENDVPINETDGPPDDLFNYDIFDYTKMKENTLYNILTSTEDGGLPYGEYKKIMATVPIDCLAASVVTILFSPSNFGAAYIKDITNALADRASLRSTHPAVINFRGIGNGVELAECKGFGSLLAFAAINGSLDQSFITKIYITGSLQNNFGRNYSDFIDGTKKLYWAGAFQSPKDKSFLYATVFNDQVVEFINPTDSEDFYRHNGSGISKGSYYADYNGLKYDAKNERNSIRKTILKYLVRKLDIGDFIDEA